MPKVNCAKCGESFEADRDHWPPNVCGDCKMNAACASCNKSFKLDPTLYGGLNYCGTHRMNLCHFCGIDPGINRQLSNCPNCYRKGVLVCNGNPKCLPTSGKATWTWICIPQHDKVPLSTYDAIKISSEQRQKAQAAVSVTKDQLHLHLGTEKNHESIENKVTEDQARVFAMDLYKHLLKIRLRSSKQTAMEFSIDESTYAVTLLYKKAEYFRVIVTFSQYNRTYTDTNLRGNESIDSAMIEADPEYEMTKKGTHQIKRKNVWYPYVRDAANDHHAEARALEFATANDLLILNIFPTKQYCTTGPKGGCSADVQTRLGAEVFGANNQLLKKMLDGSKV